MENSEKYHGEEFINQCNKELGAGIFVHFLDEKKIQSDFLWQRNY